MVNVTQQQTAEQLESELAEAEALAGIVHEETDEAAQAAPAAEGEGVEGESGAREGGRRLCGRGGRLGEVSLLRQRGRLLGGRSRGRAPGTSSGTEPRT